MIWTRLFRWSRAEGRCFVVGALEAVLGVFFRRFVMNGVREMFMLVGRVW